jgi:hypothetical protein
MYLFKIIKVFGQPTKPYFFNFKKLQIMKTLKFYHRLIWECAYTHKEVANAILNLLIALVDNDEQDIKSIIEIYQISHTELLQIQELTSKAVRKVVPTFDEVLEMREDSTSIQSIEYTEEQIQILESYYEEQRRQQLID